MFLTLVVIGLVGLLMMALPALGGHHHWPGQGHGPSAPGGGAIAHGAPHAHASASANAGDKMALVPAGHPNLRFLPSPRALFSLCALYGAFGNALVHAAHLSPASAALIAIVPAGMVEWTLVRPIWKLLFRFQGDASSPLDQLICSEAQAVSRFRNGRGMIATVRDGRRVQLAACLTPQHAALPVRFGQRLRIEDVDARRERVVVSVIAADETASHSIQGT